MPHRLAFALNDLIVVLLVVTVAGSLALAEVSERQRADWQMKNATQLRGIHQGCVIYAQGNKAGTNDGYFPGLSPKGEPTAPSTGARLSLMIERDYFTPGYIISPAEADVLPAQQGEEVTYEDFSYAMLQVFEPVDDAGRIAEWSETLNTNAVVMGDRNTAAGDERASIWSENWTDHLEGWRGTIVRNDNSTGFVESHVIEETRYGSSHNELSKVNAEDDLFKSETEEGYDAMMTFARDEDGDERVVARRAPAEAADVDKPDAPRATQPAD